MRLGLRVVERGNARAVMADLQAMVRKGVNVGVGVIDGVHGGNAELAAIHEFGTEDGHVPERSFLRSTMRAQRQPWLDFLAARMRRVVTGKLPALAALEQLGMRMAADVKAAIVAGIDPPLAASTRKAKTVNGRTGDTPLIDTGRLKESITHRVVTGEVKP